MSHCRFRCCIITSGCFKHGILWRRSGKYHFVSQPVGQCRSCRFDFLGVVPGYSSANRAIRYSLSIGSVVTAFDDFFKKTKSILFKIVEILALVVAILLLIYLLLGEASGDYIVSVAVNISLFISAVTPEALAAVALGLALYTYINKK